jgi:peptidoglycan/LPS O-acetylase OafA/YrhL
MTAGSLGSLTAAGPRPASEAQKPASVLEKAFAAHEIPGLDAMRAASVIMVVLYHERADIAPGWLGVTMFFVLSGFLITRLLLKEVRKSGRISLGTFYKRRSMRIFPVFYLCWTIATVLLLLQHQPVMWKQAAASFFYLTDYERALLPATPADFHMGISWSLAIEEQFYLLWPLALIWILKSKRRAAPIVAVAIAAIWVWRFVVVFGLHAGWTYVYNAFDTRADALLVGCWLSIVMSERQWRALPLWMLKSRWQVLVTLAAVAALVRMERLSEHHLSLQLTGLSLEPVLSGLLLLQLLFWGSLGWAFLEHPVVKLIARLSYSIYLFHPLVLSLTSKMHVPHHLLSLVSEPIILAVAAISYYLVERPIMRIRDRGREKSVLLDDGMHHAP